MKIICVIPAYKEKGNLQELTIKLSDIFRKLKIQYKILFVIQYDDGSRELLDKIKRKIPQLEYLYFPKPLGIGMAYKKGFEKCGNEYTHILTLDADLNHNPEDIPRFINAIKSNKSDIIIGSRYTKGGNFNDTRVWKRIISLLINKILTKLIRIDVHDISSGFRIIKIEVITKIISRLNQIGYPSYMELILYTKKAGFRISEIPITYTPRKWGKSKMGKLNTFVDYICFIPKALFTF